MTTVTLRMDDDFKQELDQMCDEMGMNLTTFFMIYAKRAVRDRRIPFDVTAGNDPFYSESNMRRLAHSIRQLQSGNTVTKTLAELEELTNA